MRHTIRIDTPQALCAQQGNPEQWMNESTYPWASKICEQCTQNVDCYLTGLLERRYGTWGGAWFNESSYSHRSKRNGKGHQTHPFTRRAIMRAIDFLCEKLMMSKEDFAVFYGLDERGIYRAASVHFKKHEYVSF